MELYDMIMRTVPGAKVTGNVGKRSSFEVTLNKQQIFSKLNSGGFPVFKKVVGEVVKASKGQQVDQVTELQPNSCNLI